MALSDNIRQLRIKRGLTLEELGEKVGVTRMAVHKYEMNTAKPQPEALIGLAQALNVTAEELVLGRFDKD